MGDIVELEEMRPNITLQAGDRVHVFPVAMLEDIVSGALSFDDVHHGDDILRAIVKDFLILVNEV